MSPLPSPPPDHAPPAPRPPAAFAARLFALGARIIVVVLLLAAAWPKLRDPAAFTLAVSHYRILPPLGNALVGHTLPWLELVTALCLLLPSPRRRQGAWLLAAVLFAVFLLAQISAWWRGLDITCGCFGTAGASGPIDTRAVFTRFLLLALTFTAYLQACAPGQSRQRLAKTASL